MLKTIKIDLNVKKLIPISKNNIITKIDNNKIIKAKIGAKTTMFKSRNLIRLFLA